MSLRTLRSADLALPVRRLVGDLAARLGHECRWVPLLDGPPYEAARCTCGWMCHLRDDAVAEDFRQAELEAWRHRFTATAAEIAQIMLGSGLVPGAVRAFSLLEPDFVGTVDELALIANQLAVEGDAVHRGV